MYGSFGRSQRIRTKRNVIGKGKPDGKRKSDFQETERHAQNDRNFNGGPFDEIQRFEMKIWLWD